MRQEMSFDFQVLKKLIQQLKVVMNGTNVRKWCKMFNSERTNVHNEIRSGCSLLIAEDLKTTVNKISQDRRSSLEELHCVSRSFSFYAW
ncbi:hypothetical protein TNIN_237111 [Trichonephila inaurata madagascariensis]|uniref:Mos1 transposase HTH domain-containing protein n=1 Tax=Trichonephila inaurata madagascariensis TaxID=2747483 RepID=A0A8X6XXG7_9ARAC|nr:hypothetical protein TNIN_462391 [Trichonephila inaurata madagascariensis]GFY61808.1 hypothetical protein TNIN_237111 [Trichonephila inaurata madagascariensis]